MKKSLPLLAAAGVVWLVLACQNAVGPDPSLSKADSSEAVAEPSGLPAKSEVTRNPVRAINMSAPDAYEPDNTKTTAKAIAVDGSIQEHNFYDNATDWYKFNAVAGHSYTIETWVFGNADTVVTLYNGTTSTVLASNDDKTSGNYGSKVTFTAGATKTHAFKAVSYNAKTGANLGYNVAVTDNSVTPPSPGITLPQPKKAWTVLVYLDGDNNLSSFCAQNVDQMQKVGSDSNLNIVLLYDNGATTHGYYYVQNGATGLLNDIGNPNMGSVQTAKSFITYAKDNFPADKYMWVYWNHGGAVDRSLAAGRGVCWDDTSNSHLSEVDQKDIMTFATQQFGKALELVGFDACLMATAEIFYQYRGVANYMVASEQTEPGTGWDYTALQTIKDNPAVGGDAVAKSVATKYAAANAGGKDWTMSVIDLGAAASLGSVINDFATAAINAGIGGATYSDLAKNLPTFTGYTKDLVAYLNAVQASTAIPAAVKDKALAVNNLITGRLVLQNNVGATWTNKAFGCAMTLLADTATYSLLDLCADTQWDEFLTFGAFPNAY